MSLNMAQDACALVFRNGRRQLRPAYCRDRHQPMAGTWKFNPAKSNSRRGRRPKSNPVKIEPVGEGVEAVSETVDAESKTVVTEFTAKL